MVPLLEVRPLKESEKKNMQYCLQDTREKTKSPFCVWPSVVNTALALYNLQQKALVQQGA